MTLWFWEKPTGFSLLELIIAVAIVATITGFGIPAYFQYIYKTRRIEAHTSLLSLQLAQEQFRNHCHQYATSISNQETCTEQTSILADGSHSLKLPATLLSQYYDFSLNLNPSNTNQYTLSAVAKSEQAVDMNCIRLVLDQSGNKSAFNRFNQPSSNCW